MGFIQVVDECDDDRMWDDEGNWIEKSEGYEITVNGKLLRVAAPPADGDALLCHDDYADELKFGVALFRELGCKEVLPEEGLWKLLPKQLRKAEVVSLASWDHPDIAGGKRVGSSAAMGALAKLLAGEVASLQYDHTRDNTHWSHWLTAAS